MSSSDILQHFRLSWITIYVSLFMCPFVLLPDHKKRNKWNNSLELESRMLTLIPSAIIVLIQSKRISLLMKHLCNPNMKCVWENEKNQGKAYKPGSTIVNASSNTPMPAAHPVVNSSNKAAEQIRATDWSSTTPQTHADWTVLNFSLNPWCALSNCRLDGLCSNG